MPSFIVSDIHVGSPFCRRAEFTAFLDRLPDGATLILNGDVLDRADGALAPEDAQVLARLAEESRRRPVVWIWGNHDDAYRLAEPHAIVFQQRYAIGRRLLITHGHVFDDVMPRNQWFIFLFNRLHALRLKLGAPAIHVAQYAKAWPTLYRYLRNNVRRSAVACARENGFQTVVCGHVHFAEDTRVEGIRYINTGSWTEKPSHCLVVDDTEMRLLSLAEFLA